MCVSCDSASPHKATSTSQRVCDCQPPWGVLQGLRTATQLLCRGSSHPQRPTVFSSCCFLLTPVPDEPTALPAPLLSTGHKKERGLEQLPNKAPEEPWLPLPEHGKGFMEPSYSATPKIPAPLPPSQIEVSLLDMTLYNQNMATCTEASLESYAELICGGTEVASPRLKFSRLASTAVTYRE